MFVMSFLVNVDGAVQMTIRNYVFQVYQRADMNRLLMSQSVGPFCNTHQTVQMNKNSEGAAVSLYLVEYERERKYKFF